MTIANRLLTQNGLGVVDASGMGQLMADGAAPNGVVFGADVAVSEGGVREATIVLPAADYSAYSLVYIVWHGTDVDGSTQRGIVPFAPGAGGVITLTGTETEVFGRCANMPITGFEFCPVSLAGLIGYSDGIHEVEIGGTLAAPTIGSVTISGSGVVGDVHTAVPASADGFPTPTLTYIWALDGTPTGDTAATCTPATPGVLTVEVTATNLAGEAIRESDPLAIVSAGTVPVISDALISGSGFIGALHTVSYTVSGEPAPTVTLQWQNNGSDIIGETGTTYTPTVGGTLSCEIEATNTEGTDTEEPTKVISAVEALEADEWDILTVAAEGATGRRWTKIYIDPTKSAARAWTTTSASEVIASQPFPIGFTEMSLIDAVEGWWLPPVSFNISASPGNGNVGNGTASGDATVTGPGTITLTATSATSFTVSGLVSGTATVGAEFKSGAYRFTIIAGSTAFAAADTLILSVGTRDFAIFDPAPPGQYAADTLRQARAAVVYANAGGARSPVSEDVKTVPDIPVTATNIWYPFMDRTPAEYALGIIGGQGRQRFRCVARSAADPDVVWWGMDVSGGPMLSNDAGAFYSAPQLRGCTMQEGTAGIWVDPADANRVIHGFSASDLRSSTTTPNDYDLLAGLWLSTDGGRTATHVLQLTNVRSTSASGERDNISLFAHASGGTPATRTIYYVHKPRPKAGTWGAGTLYRSTAGGIAGSWAAFGESLTNAKFGNKIFWLDRDPGGNLYLACTNGLFKSTDGGSTWTACTGFTGAVLVVNAMHGGLDVWAAQDGNGAYKATNAAGTTFARNTALGSYNIQMVSVCPANSQRILVASGVNGTNGKWSHNGGTSWGNIVNRSSTGATNDWASMMSAESPWFSWTPGSETEVIVERSQHFGKSIDGGASTDWSGNGSDYQTRKWLGYDPSDWQVMVFGTQDTVSTSTTDGQNTAFECGYTSAQRQTILNGGSAARGHGGLILRNGAHRAVLTAAGGTTGARLPIQHNASGVNLSNTITLIGSTRSGCEFSGTDTTSTALGWMGKNRFTLSGGGVLAQDKADMAQEFYGATLTASRIIGGPTSPGNTKTLYVSTDAGDTWGTWGTSPVRFAIAVGTPSAVCVSRFHANRVWVGEAYNGTGRIYKMEGSPPVNTLIFTLSTYPGFSGPATEIHGIRECPSDPTILYVLAYAAGNSYIWRVTDALTTPVFEDITYNAPLRAISWMHVHPLTDDVILGGQFGSRVLRCHDGSTAPNAGALFDRQKTFVDANIGPGVEF
jgi:hypothetical protein